MLPQVGGKLAIWATGRVLTVGHPTVSTTPGRQVLRPDLRHLAPLTMGNKDSQGYVRELSATIAAAVGHTLVGGHSTPRLPACAPADRRSR